MSLSNDTNSTWTNIEEQPLPLPLPPTVEEPIERINDTEIVNNNNDNEVIESLNDVKEPIEEVNETTQSGEVNQSLDVSIHAKHYNPPSDEISTITNTVETKEPEKEPSVNFVQKIKNMPNYVYKKLNLKCALCSSV